LSWPSPSSSRPRWSGPQPMPSTPAGQRPWFLGQ